MDSKSYLDRLDSERADRRTMKQSALTNLKVYFSVNWEMPSEDIERNFTPNKSTSMGLKSLLIASLRKNKKLTHWVHFVKDAPELDLVSIAL